MITIIVIFLAASFGWMMYRLWVDRTNHKKALTTDRDVATQGATNAVVMSSEPQNADHELDDLEALYRGRKLR